MSYDIQRTVKEKKNRMDRQNDKDPLQLKTRSW